MSDFEDFIKGKEEHPEPNFPASLDCQACGENVLGGYVDYATRTLHWWCSKNHHSFIEKFGM